jgi:hypothetical protein
VTKPLDKRNVLGDTTHMSNLNHYHHQCGQHIDLEFSLNTAVINGGVEWFAEANFDTKFTTLWEQNQAENWGEAGEDDEVILVSYTMSELKPFCLVEGKPVYWEGEIPQEMWNSFYRQFMLTMPDTLADIRQDLMYSGDMEPRR